ncbi:DUF6261 family protein [uncultured Acetobacteroides sp.]|uniref:DUF6261 family protein n=1 Tax=uncultured Acetobacteroides sp. TaxID=1760811 RepID=UPI0029F5287D|nr:DUF6261 family protein [uncultured Acetobacteroides sp.]
MNLYFSTSKMLLKDEVDYGKKLDSQVVGSGIEGLTTSKPYLLFKEANANLARGYMLSRKSEFTERLFELDQKRGNSYRGLYHGVQSYLYSDVAAEVLAAKRLNVLFEHYGFDFLEGSYSGESSTLASFIEDLKKPENAAALVALKLEPKQAQLVNDVTAFDTTYSQKVDDKDSKADFVAATRVRREFEQATKNILVYVQGKLLEDSNPKWETLCSKILLLNQDAEKTEALHQAALKNKREKEKEKDKEKDKDKKSEGQK